MYPGRAKNHKAQLSKDNDDARRFCKRKSVDFMVEYLASSCQFTCRYFYGRLLVEHFQKSRYGRVI